jgi:hypothetical protein
MRAMAAGEGVPGRKGWEVPPSGAEVPVDFAWSMCVLLIRQEDSGIAFPPFSAKGAEKDGATRQYLVAGSIAWAIEFNFVF